MFERASGRQDLLFGPPFISLAVRDDEALKMRARLLGLALLTAFLFPASLGAQGAGDDQVREHFQAAKGGEQTGEYEPAAAEYQTVLKLRPEVAEVHTDLGLGHYRQGEKAG